MDNVAIFWDYENCPIPSNVSGYAVVNNLQTLAQPYGSVRSLKAYLGLTEQLPMPKAVAVRSELQSSGVSLVDCPHNGRKDVADKMIIVDMLAHAIDNPAPSTIILITGDRDFAYAISILRLRRYRIILVTLPNAHPSLTAQASVCLSWNETILPPNVAPESPNIYEKLLPPEQQEFPENDVLTSPSNTFKSPRVDSVQTRPDSIPNYIYIPSTPKRFVHGTSASVESRKPSMANVQSQAPSPLTSRVRSWSQTRLQSQVSTSQFEEGVNIQSHLHPFHSRPKAFPSQPQQPVPQFRKETRDDLTYSHHDEELKPPSPSKLHQPILQFADEPRGDLSYDSPFKIQHSIPESTDIPRNNPVHIHGNDELKPQSPSISSKQNGSPALVSESEQAQHTTIASPVHELDITRNNVLDATTSSSALHETAPQPVIENEEPVVPLHFEVLVQCLKKLQLKGISHPSRSTVAIEVGKHNPYKKLGIQKFKQYSAMAEALGIVDLGGAEADAWICLKPQWKHIK